MSRFGLVTPGLSAGRVFDALVISTERSLLLLLLTAVGQISVSFSLQKLMEVAETNGT